MAEVTLKSGEKVQLSEREQAMRDRLVPTEAKQEETVIPQQPIQPTEPTPQPSQEAGRFDFQKRAESFNIEPQKPEVQQPKGQEVQLKSGEKSKLSEKESQMRQRIQERQERQAEEAEKKQKQADVLNGFQELLQSRASREELASYINENPEYRSLYNVAYTNTYRSNENFDFVQKYGTKTAEELYQDVYNSEVIPGTEKWNLLPQELRNEYIQLVEEKRISSTVEERKQSIDNDIEKVVNTPFQEPQVPVTVNYIEQYEKIMNTPEIKGLESEVTDLSIELKDLEDEIANITDSVIASLPEGTPIYTIMGKVNKATKELEKAYKSKYNRYSSKLALLSDRKSQASTRLELLNLQSQQDWQVYSAKLSQYNTNRDRMDRFDILELEQENQKLAEQRQINNQKELLLFQQNLENQNKKVEKYEIGRDGKMYAIVDGQAQVVKSFDGEVLFGEDTKTYSTNIIDNKDGTYTQIKAYQDGRTPEISTYDAKGQMVSGIPDVISDIIAQCRVQGQCGQGANDYASKLGLGRIFGNSYESKAKYIQEGAQPQVGGFAIWNPNQGQGRYSEYGHVGIVTGYNAQTGKVQITDWNYDGDEKQKTHEVNLSEITYNGGFYNPESIPGATQGFSKEVQDWGDNIINDVGGAKITSIKDDTLRSQVSSYIAEKMKEQPNQNIATLKSKLQIIEELESHPGLSGAIGIGSKGLIPGTESASFMAKLDQLDAVNFMEGIQGMKGMGSLSNAEGLKVSASISSIGDTGQSEASFKKELARLKEVLEGRIKITEEDAGVTFDIYGRPMDGNVYIPQQSYTPPRTGSLMTDFTTSFNDNELYSIYGK